MNRVALVGTGVVGSSWSLVFARAGADVNIYDPDRASAGRVVDYVRSALSAPEAPKSAAGGDSETILSRLKIVPSLEEAVAGVDYIQESAPERLDVKKELYKRLDAAANPSAILASSTSGLPASSFTEGLEHRQRCLVVHPINPPHLIPLVEIVPAPWTAPDVVDRAIDLMREVNQSPIRLRREINGFVVNRLQSAILGEAFRLVEDGICDANEVDLAISDGLGLRWFFMGPFETIDLNAPAGVRDYVERYESIYSNIFESVQWRADWTGPALDAIEAERRAALPADRLVERQAWRDRRLMALAAHKRRANSEIGR